MGARKKRVAVARRSRKKDINYILIIIIVAIIILGLTTINYVAKKKVLPAPPELVAYYPLDTDANDASGKGNNGVLVSGEFVPGIKGSAVLLNGTTDYINVPDSSTLNSGEGENFSISLWINPKELSARTEGILSKKFSDSSSGYVIYYNNAYQKIGFRIGDGTDSGVWAIKPNLNEWTYLTVTVSDNGAGKNINLYYNGVFDNSYLRAVSSVSNSEDLTIGYAKTWNAYFNGLIDEVKIYNYALNPNDILQEYVNIKGISSLSCGLLLSTAENSYDSKCRDSNYNKIVDIDNNEKIDIYDVASLGRNYGNDTWCSIQVGKTFDPCHRKVLEFKLDEGAGSVAGDTSRNENNGTITGAAWFDGISGKSLEFYGRKDMNYVTSVDSSSLGFLGNQITVSAWIRNSGALDSCYVHGIAYKEIYLIKGFRLVLAGGFGSMASNKNKILAQFYYPKDGYPDETNPDAEEWWGGSIDLYSTNILDSNWHNVVAVYNGSYGKLYIDGNKQAELKDERIILNAPSRPLYIGRVGGHCDFTGRIDEVNMWNYALTDAEILNLYSPLKCGNGFVDSGEQCDTENFGGKNCASEKGMGYTGSLSCNADCTINTDDCHLTCGNNAIDSGEDCDLTNLNSKTCTSFSQYSSGVLACGNNCLFNYTGCVLANVTTGWVTYTITDNEFSSGINKLLGVMERLKFNVTSEWHYAGVVELTSSDVRVNITSTEQQSILEIGETKEFNVDGVSGNDFSLKLNSISSNKADLTIKKISTSPPQPVCGDGSCNGVETSTSCPADCQPTPVCGDNVCNGVETSTLCPADCPVQAYCGDNICQSNENCLSCSGDCGCSEGETCENNVCVEIPKSNWVWWLIIIFLILAIIAVIVVIVLMNQKKKKQGLAAKPGVFPRPPMTPPARPQITPTRTPIGYPAYKPYTPYKPVYPSQPKPNY